MKVQQGFVAPNQWQCEQLANLIYASGQDLFDLIFGSSFKAINYLNKACEHASGQFGYDSHFTILANEASLSSPGSVVAACMTLWTHEPSTAYVDATLRSLGRYLSKEQLQDLSQFNRYMQEALPPPLEHEMCVGHLSVAKGFQRMGLASQLCQFALAKAKEQKKNYLVLDVQSTNKTAIMCYQKFGFSTQKQTKLSHSFLSFNRMILPVKL